MTIQKSIILMSNTSEEYDVLGAPFRADSWFGYTDGLHTVSINYMTLVGNFHIQGSLSTDPDDETSWFDIDINATDNFIQYIEFNGESGTNAFTFIGNFTFLRAVLSRTPRTDIDPNPLDPTKTDVNQGSIDKVILAM